MEFLELLENIRVPGLNELMLGITELGSVGAFLVIALTILWCFSKKLGYYLFAVGFLGTVANQFMKLAFHIPRPWVLNENLTIVEEARRTAGGYSFPSGHTQNAVGTFGTLLRVTDKKWVKIVSITLIIGIPFSRMYLGVHTPWDVLASFVIGAILVFMLYPVFMGNHSHSIVYFFACMILVSIGFLCYTEFYPFSQVVDRENLDEAVQVSYTLLGAISGFAVACYADYKWIRYPTDAVWWAQIIKVCGGILLIIVVKSVLKVPLTSLFGHCGERAIRYFLVTITAGCIWPLTFRYFSYLRR